VIVGIIGLTQIRQIFFLQINLRHLIFLETHVYIGIHEEPKKLNVANLFVKKIFGEFA